MSGCPSRLIEAGRKSEMMEDNKEFKISDRCTKIITTISNLFAI